MKKSQFGLAERWMQMQPNGQHGCITIISYLMKMIMYNQLKSIQWILLQLFYSEKDMPIKQLLLNLMHIISLLLIPSFIASVAIPAALFIYSNQDIEYIKRAAGIATEAMYEGINKLKVGVRESDVVGEIVRKQIQGTPEYGG